MSTKVEISPIIQTKTSPFSSHLLKLRKASLTNPDRQHFLLNKPPTTPFIRQILLSKITFNISRGHFSFVHEMLKSHLENEVAHYVNPNELVSDTNVWLQLESSQQNKKFLIGKTPLILCSYIKVF